ncbi:unnamed protein product [Orchesella dallaii]|uniref:ER-bound oxygenase mpaB/mpaB'/Rubber oxygenase catalytic domain-containing protein n=1 Tax=Orchesella dallaii TaxID=48710 RepID=A0ABP1RAQ3_9HEXA
MGTHAHVLRGEDGDNNITIISTQKHKTGELEDQDMYTALITVAPFIPGDSNPIVPLSQIPWIDHSLLKHGLWFYATHLTYNVFVSAILSLMLGFSVKSLSTAVHRGRLDKHDASFSKFMKTIKGITKLVLLHFDHVKLYENYSKIRKQHAMVRKLMIRSKTELKAIPSQHGSAFCEEWKRDVANAVKSDLNHVDTSSAPTHLITWDPKVPINQFDMSLTQLGLVWILSSFPRLFGIRNVREELKGVLHIWAVHGRLLGIQDEFNIFIKQDYSLYDKLFKNVFIEGLKTMDETVITLQTTLIEAISSHLPFMTYKAVLYVGLQEVEGNKGEHVWKLMSWLDKVSVGFIQFWLWSMRQTCLVRFCMDIFTLGWLMWQFRWDIYDWIRRNITFYFSGKKSVLNRTTMIVTSSN